MSVLTYKASGSLAAFEMLWFDESLIETPPSSAESSSESSAGTGRRCRWVLQGASSSDCSSSSSASSAIYSSVRCTFVRMNSHDAEDTPRRK
jgi:hypothetical protein